MKFSIDRFVTDHDTAYRYAVGEHIPVTLFADQKPVWHLVKRISFEPGRAIIELDVDNSEAPEVLADKLAAIAKQQEPTRLTPEQIQRVWDIQPSTRPQIVNGPSE